MNRDPSPRIHVSHGMDGVDMTALDEAAARYRRGEVAEALYWIERALPYAFAGLADRCAPKETRR